MRYLLELFVILQIYNYAVTAKKDPSTMMWDAVTGGDAGSRVQLTSREIQDVFETVCQSDFKAFREFVKYYNILFFRFSVNLSISSHVRSIKPWSEPLAVLELGNGACWKLVLRMLARGRLRDPSTNLSLKITCRTLLIENREELFKDI